MTKEPVYNDDYKRKNMEAIRQTTVDRLTDAFSKDFINMEEFEKRVKLANIADKPSTLEDLVIDLPAFQAPVSKPKASTQVSTNTDSSLIGAPSVSSMCVLSERRFNGNWLTSDKVSSFTVLGSTVYDFRDSVLPPGPTKLDVFTVMGDVKIIVPPNLPVRLNTSTFMADQKLNRNVNQRVRDSESWLEVSGFVLMGDVNVTI